MSELASVADAPALAVVVNGVLSQPRVGDAVAAAYASMQRQALESVPARLARLPTSIVPLTAVDMVGVGASRLAAGTSDVDIEPTPRRPQRRAGGLHRCRSWSTRSSVPAMEPCW